MGNMQYERRELLTARSERVKGIDFHPTESWILTTLYSGHANIWSFETKSIVKTFELTDVPVRAGRFVARKNWIVCGSDDFHVRVYNYNTVEKVTSFEAHPDYIRAIVVHPVLPLVLTASDDMTIKCWNWENGWALMQTYEDHSHYVMGLAINPKDTNTFASACLDRTVKVWSIGSKRPNYTIEAHETKGVNHVEYYPHADNPYLLTTSDDQSVKIWDYTNKQCINTLGGSGHRDGHSSNVSFACYHSTLPLIISGSEDGTVRIWDSTTFELLDIISYKLERAWCVSSQRAEQGIAVGFDDGAVVFKLGRDDPAISMEERGWLAWYTKKELHIARLAGQTEEGKDGAQVNTTSIKREDFSSFYPLTIAHSKSTRFFSVCGATEYSIHSARGGKRGESIETVGQGSGSDFVWGVNTRTNNFAIRSSDGDVIIMNNKDGFSKPEQKKLDFSFKVDGLTGGVLLGVKTSDSILMYDWDNCQLVRQISASPKDVYWSESGELCALACKDTIQVLEYDRAEFLNGLRSGGMTEEGVETSFSIPEGMRNEGIEDNVRSGRWAGECFMYTDDSNRLKYLARDKQYTVAHFDKPMYLLSYLAAEGKGKGKGTAYLTDKDMNIVTYSIPLSLVEYQTLVLQQKHEQAAEKLATIEDEDQLNKIARFLADQGEKQTALEVTKDQEHRFELALELNDLSIALEIAQKTDVEERWKTVGDAAMAAYDLAEAEKCFNHAKDLGSLLLLYTAANNGDGLRELTKIADAQAAHNVAFSCLWYLGDLDGCIDLLLRTDKSAEAVLFSQTYKPSRCREIVNQLKAKLDSAGKTKVSRVLGVPPEKGQSDDTELFPEWENFLQNEENGRAWKVEEPLVDVSEETANGKGELENDEVDA